MTTRSVNFSSFPVRCFVGLVGGISASNLAEAVEHGIVAADRRRAVHTLVFASGTNGAALAAELTASHEVGRGAVDRVAADATLGRVRHESLEDESELCHCVGASREMEAVA